VKAKGSNSYINTSTR